MKEYFSHDYNSRNDKKLISLSMKHGLEGVGAYWCIIEMLYEEVGYISIKEYERIAFELRTDKEFIKSIIEGFELFVIKDEMFSSESAIERIKQRMDKSDKARESVNARWDKYERNTNVLGTKNECNTIKVKESKVNEKKEVFNFRKSFLDLGVETQILDDWLKVRKNKKATNSETAFNKLKSQIEKSGLSINKGIKLAAENSWSGFNAEWVDRKTPIEKDRSENPTIYYMDIPVPLDQVIVDKDFREEWLNMDGQKYPQWFIDKVKKLKK